uniref:Uncharacterized protein n=1 Tax=Candidatus Kentrum sp. LFY TaxID=2126342 RepID=A0A450U5J2_9GAMM|nr:MAG: hypothetical protein BECKLFY1418B_GA0070995_100333 [Candidatus Kentron sp. LFY]
MFDAEQTQQTLTLQCCCEQKRRFHLRTEIDTGAGPHLVSRLVKCPFCDNHCKLTIEASRVSVQSIFRGRSGPGHGLENESPDDPLMDSADSPRHRAPQGRVFATELAEKPPVQGG